MVFGTAMSATLAVGSQTAPKYPYFLTMSKPIGHIHCKVYTRQAGLSVKYSTVYDSTIHYRARCVPVQQPPGHVQPPAGPEAGWAGQAPQGGAGGDGAGV